MLAEGPTVTKCFPVLAVQSSAWPLGTPFCFTLSSAAAEETQEPPPAAFNHKKLYWGEETACSEFSSGSGTFL